VSSNMSSTPSERAGTTTALLRHFEWSPTSKVPGKYEVWTTRGTADEILVPLDPLRGDFDVLLDRVLATLLLRHGNDVRKVQDLLTLRIEAHLRSTRWRKQTPLNAGLISWSEGEALFRAAQESLSASAKGTEEKRMLHGTSGSYIARKFLERTLMGQTEIGSFIITALVPSAERFHKTQRSENRSVDDWREADMVTGDQILATLESSLEAVRSGLDEYKKAPSIDGFVPLIQDGVSFELIRALTDLTNGGDAAVSIERGGTGVTESPRVAEIAFDAVESKVLNVVAQKFKEAKPPEPVVVSGEVSLLDNSSSSPVHLVRLDIKTGSKVRRARLRLSPEQYDLAVEAHRSHNWLHLSGRLQRDGRDYWLYNAERVRIVDSALGPESMTVTLYSDDQLERRMPFTSPDETLSIDGPPRLSIEQGSDRPTID
jgi:hypothetical protein